MGSKANANLSRNRIKPICKKKSQEPKPLRLYKNEL